MAVVNKTELIKLQKSLGTDDAIAKKLKVTRQRIQQLRKLYGIDSRYAKNPKRNKQMLSLFRTGNSATEIARKFSLSVSQVYRLIDKGRRKKK
jgi:DNA invertase Pin-like site-specific DNA recombinase